MKLERIKAIYDEISKYELKLAPDPRSAGPLYLQNMIAECRNFLNAVSRIQLEVHREKQDLARTARAEETSYDVAFAELLSNDERVRRLPSIEDRKATVNLILREQLNVISGLKAQLQDLDYVEKAIRHRHRELTSTMTEIKLQRSLIRDEMDSGAMYGDERKSDHERGAGPIGDEIDEGELDALLAQEEAKAEAPVVPEPAEVGPAESSVDEVRAFLDDPKAVTTATVEEDFSEVFDRL